MSRGIASARKSLNDFGKHAGKIAAGGAAAAFAGIAASIMKAVEAGGQLNDMMARTGAAGEGLVVMQKAFENAGLAASSVPDALQRMQKAMAGTDGRAFDAIGLSVSELINMDAAEAFEKVAEGIARIENPAMRSKAAMDIFGKSGGKLLAIFNDSEAFDLAKTQVGGLGKTLGENAAKLDAVGDAFGSLETKVLQLGASVAVGVLPTLEKLGDKLNQADFTEFGDKIGVIADKAVKLAEALGSIASITPAFQLGKLAEFIAYDGGKLTEDDIKKAKELADTLAKADKMNGKSQLPPLEMMGPPSSLANGPELYGPPISAMMPAISEALTEALPLVDQWMPPETVAPAREMANEYQRRGLSLDPASSPTAKNEKESVNLLKEIRDVLKDPKRKPTW